MYVLVMKRPLVVTLWSHFEVIFYILSELILEFSASPSVTMEKMLKDCRHFDFVELDLDYNNRSFDFLKVHVTQDNLKKNI